MSGHSKWAKIKRAKGAADAKRGAEFTKLGNQITLAAKSGGGDPSMNFVLRLAIDKAKGANMPKDNIQKAIERGLGTGKDSVIFENVRYEAMYNGNIMLIIDCLTDNKNRTVADIKKILENGGATMGAVNSVSWQFEEKGRVNIYLAKVVKSTKYGGADSLVRVSESLDDITLSIIDIPGVNDVSATEFVFEGTDELTNDGNSEYNGLEIFTSRNDLNNVYKEIDKMGYRIESAEIIMTPKSLVSVNEDKITKFENLLENLDDQDDVQNVWNNAENYQ